jgi:hypothetical protein
VQNINCTRHNFDTKEIEMLQDRVNNLQVLDEELLAMRSQGCMKKLENEFFMYY